MFEGLIKKSAFSCFLAVFISSFPRFWGSRGIHIARTTQGMFERYDQKLVVFAFYGRFDMLLATILGFPRRFTCLRVITKNSMLLRFMPIFISYLPIVLGFRGIENDCKTRYMFEAWPKTHHFCVLWPFSWAIARSSRVSRRFTCLRVMTKKSSVLCSTAIFMSYCPYFWGSKAIANDYKTSYMFEGLTKTRHFFILWPFS